MSSSLPSALMELPRETILTVGKFFFMKLNRELFTPKKSIGSIPSMFSVISVKDVCFMR